MSRMENILEAKSLSKSFKPHFWSKSLVRLKDLSFSLPEGSATALLGHNGAGKTTTIRILLGIVKSESGSVLFRGNHISDHDKAQIGYMPENNKLAINLTPLEILDGQLAMLSFGKKERNQKIQEVLEVVGLAQHQHKQVRSLSKGLGRRLAWAQATIHSPSLVILDEPFSGLDPLGRAELECWIAQLREQGVSLLMSTHELDAAQRTCDRFFLLRSGQLVKEVEGVQNQTWIEADRIKELFSPESITL